MQQKFIHVTICTVTIIGRRGEWKQPYTFRGPNLILQNRPKQSVKCISSSLQFSTVCSEQLTVVFLAPYSIVQSKLDQISDKMHSYLEMRADQNYFCHPFIQLVFDQFTFFTHLLEYYSSNILSQTAFSHSNE